ncbi:oligoendopeptidase F family protein [Candidatus Gracilibacteria bacterium]|nr:oligoendopeptidase F family protein [Candidatus Gracilibacteria bacterium]
MTATLPRRADVAPAHTWDLSRMFADEHAWEQAYQEVERTLPALAAFSGRLSSSAAELNRWFTENAYIAVLIHRVYAYSSLAYDVDTADQRAAGLRDRALGLFARYQAATAFAEPELLALADKQIAALLAAEPQLEVYHHYFDNLQRQRRPRALGRGRGGAGPGRRTADEHLDGLPGTRRRRSAIRASPG